MGGGRSSLTQRESRKKRKVGIIVLDRVDVKVWLFDPGGCQREDEKHNVISASHQSASDNDGFS